MMKAIILVLLGGLSFAAAKAQTWDEWFKQKKTQKKYLLQQVAALQVYIGYAKKGYNIAKDGLGFIGDVKNGEFGLHNAFFGSLKSVNPEIRKYYKVAQIIELQADILKSCNETKKQLRKAGMMRAEELTYISESFDRMLDNCADLVDELITVTTANKLELKDDERIRRIDAIDQQMRDNYSFTYSFGNEARILSASRKRELDNIQVTKALNGIKK